MFFWTYLHRELRRRAGRTLFTAVGLAVGVGLVATVTSLSDGLDRSQQQVLDPLSSVGTDLVVAQHTDVAAQATRGLGRPNAQLDSDAQALLQESQSVVTDLAQLGEPGDQFVHDFFLPATQLSFDSTVVDDVGGLDGVEAAAGALTLQVTHQEGTVPEIVAEIETGGETFDTEISFEPPTEEEAIAIQQCLAERQAEDGGDAPTGPPEGGGPGEGFGGGPGGGFIGGQRLQECLPERFQRQIASITTPLRSVQQVLDPPETDITSEQYTVAGVDLATDGLGLITVAQITDGEFLSGPGEVVASTGYAEKVDLAVGDELTVNDSTVTVVGLAKPPLGGQAADLYFELGELQAMSQRDGRVNSVLVRATDADAVAALTTSITDVVPGAEVTSAEQLASQVSGSLLDASSIVDSVGLVFVIVVLIVVFALASLLTLSSVSKRIRELGTLKAIGWRQGLVVRQVLGETLVVGLLAAVLGVGLGVGGVAVLNAVGPSLEATAPAATGPSDGLFGLGQVAAAPDTPEDASTAITLDAPVDAGVVGLAIALALAGALIAGAVGGWRAARLRPADALRDVG